MNRYCTYSVDCRVYIIFSTFPNMRPNRFLLSLFSVQMHFPFKNRTEINRNKKWTIDMEPNVWEANFIQFIFNNNNETLNFIKYTNNRNYIHFVTDVIFTRFLCTFCMRTAWHKYRHITIFGTSGFEGFSYML